MLFPPKPRLAFHTANGDRAKNALANAVNGAQWWAHTFTRGIDRPVTRRTVSQSSSSVRGIGRRFDFWGAWLCAGRPEGVQNPEGLVGKDAVENCHTGGGLVCEPAGISEADGLKS